MMVADNRLTLDWQIGLGLSERKKGVASHCYCHCLNHPLLRHYWIDPLLARPVPINGLLVPIMAMTWW